MISQKTGFDLSQCVGSPEVLSIIHRRGFLALKKSVNDAWHHVRWCAREKVQQWEISVVMKQRQVRQQNVFSQYHHTSLRLSPKPYRYTVAAPPPLVPT